MGLWVSSLWGGWPLPLPDLKEGIVISQSFCLIEIQFRRVWCEWICVSSSYSTRVECISQLV